MTKSKFKALLDSKQSFLSKKLHQNLVLLMNSADFTSINEEYINNIAIILNQFSSIISENEKKYMLEIFQDVFVKNANFNFLYLHEGEDVDVNVYNDTNEDWSNYNIIIRNEYNLEKMSYNNIMGLHSFQSPPNNFQKLDIINILKQNDGLNKALILLEVSTNGIASGNAIRVLDKFYFILKRNVK